MGDGMTIGQLASSTRLPSSTIRYYERAGLLPPAGRTAGNYRYYGPEAGERLAFIRAAQSAGFELADIKAMLAYQDGRSPACAEVRRMVSNRLESVSAQLRRLRRVERVLLDFQRVCERRPRARTCPVLDALSPASGRSGRRR